MCVSVSRPCMILPLEFKVSEILRTKPKRPTSFDVNWLLLKHNTIVIPFRNAWARLALERLFGGRFQRLMKPDSWNKILRGKPNLRRYQHEWSNEAEPRCQESVLLKGAELFRNYGWKTINQLTRSMERGLLVLDVRSRKLTIRSEKIAMFEE